jgi:ribosomal protein S27AE
MSNSTLDRPVRARHPFDGETVLFSTKHEKEKILGPILSEIGMSCIAVEIDTDQFGTFSGEIERTGTVRETLRKKIRAANESSHSGRFILASEGSFGPHPITGLIQTDLESLLLWDRFNNVEIYAEYLCLEPTHSVQILGPKDDFESALRLLKFPEHAIIVHPEGKLQPIFKGLCDFNSVANAILESYMASNSNRVVISNDLRALHNPTRRGAILQAGRILIDKLNSLCPNCSYPGFSIARGIPGLPCVECGTKSPVAKDVSWECAKCMTTEIRPRPDGKTSIEASDCEHCNP